MGGVGDCVPILLVVWPEVSQHWSLQAIGWCQNSDLQESSHQGIFPGVSTSSVLIPTVSHSHPPPAPQETLQDLQVGLAQAPMESLFCPGSQCTWKLVCVLKEWSLCFPRSLQLLHSSLTGLQSQILWGLLLLMPDLQPVEHDVGAQNSLLWENLYNVTIFLFVGCPTGRYEIWWYQESAPPTISLWLPLCLWR